MNNTKIYTIEDFLKDIYNKTKERVLQELNWNALYNITLRKKEKYNLLSCSISGSCGGLKFSYCSDDKQSFKVGDISNDFYQCLTYDRYTEMYTIDEENLNNFIKKYFEQSTYWDKSSNISNYINFMTDLDSFNYSLITDIIKSYFEYIDEVFFNTSYRKNFCTSNGFYERKNERSLYFSF